IVALPADLNRSFRSFRYSSYFVPLWTATFLPERSFGDLMCFGLPPWTTSARCVRMYRTAGNLAVRFGVTKMPLMTTWHLCAARAGSRPVNAVPTKVAFTRQSFAIAFAMSMSNPTGLPLVVFDSIGGKRASCQYLREPFAGAATWGVAPPLATPHRAAPTR